MYREVSDGIAHGGIEYYLPLFFDSTATLLDYLPDETILFAPADHAQILDMAWQEIHERYELCSLDPERPVLRPEESFSNPGDIADKFSVLGNITYSSQSVRDSDASLNLPVRLPPALRIEARYEDAARALVEFLNTHDGRVLFSADSPGSAREYL